MAVPKGGQGPGGGQEEEPAAEEAAFCEFFPFLKVDSTCHGNIFHIWANSKTTFEPAVKWFNAYTHGPVTGSGPSVKPLKYVTHLLVASPWPGEVAKGPHPSSSLPPPLFSQCESHGRLLALAVRKT